MTSASWNACAARARLEGKDSRRAPASRTPRIRPVPPDRRRTTARLPLAPSLHQCGRGVLGTEAGRPSNFKNYNPSRGGTGKSSSWRVDCHKISSGHSEALTSSRDCASYLLPWSQGRRRSRSPAMRGRAELLSKLTGPLYRALRVVAAARRPSELKRFLWRWLALATTGQLLLRWAVSLEMSQLQCEAAVTDSGQLPEMMQRRSTRPPSGSDATFREMRCFPEAEAKKETKSPPPQSGPLSGTASRRHLFWGTRRRQERSACRAFFDIRCPWNGGPGGGPRSWVWYRTLTRHVSGLLRVPL